MPAPSVTVTQMQHKGNPVPSGRTTPTIGYTSEMDLALVDIREPDAPDVLERACAAHGFFRIPMDLVDTAVADAAWDDARRFFDLAERDRLEVAFPEPGYPYGYAPFRAERLASSLGDDDAVGDLKASFAVGPDCLGPIDHVAVGAEAWIRSPSRWPSALPGLRTSWEAWFRAQSELAGRLLSVMAVALDLDPAHFEPLIDRHTSAMRALHYPALDRDDRPDGALRAGAHTDYGTLTILRTDDIPGLEIRDAAGTWQLVTPVPGTFIVNLGDSIAQWTNDRWRSTLHRVTPTDHRDRRSMAFFHMANWDAEIAPLPTCVGPDRPARHEPVLAGPWLMEKFRSTVT